MNALLFEPLGINLFQLIAVISVVATVCTLIGMAWGGRARDEVTLHFGCHSDVQAAARAGLIERRKVARSPMVRIPDPDHPGKHLRVPAHDPRAIKAMEERAAQQVARAGRNQRRDSERAGHLR